MTEHLQQLAQIWATATGRSLSRLATRVQNDGRFFDRLQQSNNCTTGTFEKFLTFFRDAANWPDSVIPQAATDLLDNFENIASATRAEGGECAGGDAAASHGDGDSASAAASSTGLSQEMSRGVAA